MHRGPDVIRRTPVTLPQSVTVQRACQEMQRHRIGAILVIDDERRLLGIFTGRDVVRLLAEGRNPSHTHLAAVMTREPTHLAPGHDAREALRLMHEGGFRHVPVVENGQVVGLVTYGDVGQLDEARLDDETGIWERL